MRIFDHIILGTGQATGTLLGKLIPTGDSIAVIESNTVGGSCVNFGCTPTKALVASARAIHKARQGAEYGFEVSDMRIDYDRIRSRMNEIRHASRNGLTEFMESSKNVSLIRGHGHFISETTIEVSGEHISGGNIYINTGTHPFMPPIHGIEHVNWLDSGRLLDLDELPSHLIIVGGGYIGMEMSQIYRRFGCQVTVIQRGSQVMPREDSDVADAVQQFLEEEGVEIMLDANAEKVLENDEGIKVVVSRDGKETTIVGSHLLIASGRRPNSKKLNLGAAGIRTNERGYINVDDTCHTGVGNVYALGDVNGHGAFTHTSVNDAEIVINQMFGDKTRKISDRIPIYGLFTDPPLGRVGLSEKAAIEKGHNVLKATRPMRDISRAKEMSETKGFAKLLVDAETDLILGASILGPGGDEIINMFAAIMHSNIPCREYRRVVLVHPTISELMPWILDGIGEEREKAG